MKGKQTKKMSERCTFCNKRCYPMSILCKCSFKYCIDCISTSAHNCDHDAINDHKKLIEKNNKVIVPKKMDKI